MKTATQKKWCSRAVLLFTPVFFFIKANLAFGETKVFVEEYTYQASNADSKLSSRVIAIFPDHIFENLVK
jgi:hypothetical protein